MLTSLIRLVTGQAPAEDYDREFITHVSSAPPREARSRRSERLLIAGWALIVLKCFLTWWAIGHYDVPVHSGWIIAPTLFSAGICTWLYLRR